MDQLTVEKLKLDKELRDHIAKHGFNYPEYCAPPAGSFYESYRKRMKEIEDQLLPKLTSSVGPWQGSSASA